MTAHMVTSRKQFRSKGMAFGLLLILVLIIGLTRWFGIDR